MPTERHNAICCFYAQFAATFPFKRIMMNFHCVFFRCMYYSPVSNGFFVTDEVVGGLPFNTILKQKTLIQYFFSSSKFSNFGNFWLITCMNLFNLGKWAQPPNSTILSTASLSTKSCPNAVCTKFSILANKLAFINSMCEHVTQWFL